MLLSRCSVLCCPARAFVCSQPAQFISLRQQRLVGRGGFGSVDNCISFAAFCAGCLSLVLFFPSLSICFPSFSLFCSIWFFLHCFLHSAFVVGWHHFGVCFFSAAPQWCTWASNACAPKCVFALLLLPSILPCTSSQVFAEWSFAKIAFSVPPLFSRASVFRLFVGGSLLRREPYLFSWWFSGWPFSSDFHLAPALLGSAPFLDVLACIHVFSWLKARSRLGSSFALWSYQFGLGFLGVIYSLAFCSARRNVVSPGSFCIGSFFRKT